MLKVGNNVCIVFSNAELVHVKVVRINRKKGKFIGYCSDNNITYRNIPFSVIVNEGNGYVLTLNYKGGVRWKCLLKNGIIKI